jgi:prepilin-type N-terminal cleavage/methylation domain-containing protein
MTMKTDLTNKFSTCRVRPAIQRVADYKSAIRQIANLRYGRTGHRAFSLIEMIGVLAVMAILAAVLAPALIRQMDKIVGDQESAALTSFGDALQASILRSRAIPSDTNWASTVATELGLDAASVTNSPRGHGRFFLIDPDLSIKNAGLPYTQSTAGAGAAPVSPRVLILSTIGRGLPAGIASGVASSTNFNAIWDWNDAGSVVPATSFAEQR